MMAYVIHLSTALTLAAKHVFQKGPSFYYQRRIPEDLRHLYGNKRTFIQSLKTRDPILAAKRAQALAKQQDAYWASLRHGGDPRHGMTAVDVGEAAKVKLAQYGLEQGDWMRTNDPDAEAAISEFIETEIEPFRSDDELERDEERAEDILPPVTLQAFRMLKGESTYRLSDALALYLKRLPQGNDAPNKRARRFAETTFAILKEALNGEDRVLTDIRRSDATRFVEFLSERGLKTASIRRRFGPVVAAYSLAMREFELPVVRNPFARPEIPQLGEDEIGREPFSADELATVADACAELDDEIRWAVAILADTGARMGEVIGLRLSDLYPNAETPHLSFQPHALRRLKTRASARNVPLVGVAKWAVERILATAKQGQTFAFPRYVREDGIASTHASNTINKWLRKLLKGDKTAHSFRHAMRDRLREAGAPKDIQDAVGGWSREDIGANYGKGYSLKLMSEWMSKTALSPKSPKAALNAEKRN